MRWSIRNQILLPFVGVVLLAVVAMTAVAAVVAARQRDEQTRSQLQNVLATLEHTKFPFSANVLDQLRGVSGAHFIACNKTGEISSSTIAVGSRLPQVLANLPAGNQLASLPNQPALELGGTRYFLARMEPRGDADVRALYVLYPVANWSRARWIAAFPPLAVGAVAVLLTAAVSGGLAQRFGARIRQLQQQVAAIAAGDFSEIPVHQRHDEIQELVASVNSMSAQLRTMQGTIRNSERERLLAQLAGGLAHQLRNAVAGARMSLQLHQRRCAAAPEDKSLSVALRQLSLTETQIKGLLSLGRSEQHPPRISDVNQLLDDVAVLVQPACEHAFVTLELAPADAPVLVQADLESLRAAILNLATNAIEAAGQGGVVSMATRRAAETAIVEIGDTGRGPVAAVADSLFDPFVTTKPEGVGLGLALVRQVALDHGGNASWSREAGQTVFRLVLPAVKPLDIDSEFRAPNSGLKLTAGSAAPRRQTGD